MIRHNTDCLMVRNIIIAPQDDTTLGHFDVDCHDLLISSWKLTPRRLPDIQANLFNSIISVHWKWHALFSGLTFGTCGLNSTALCMASTAFISAVLSPRLDAASGENLRESTPDDTQPLHTKLGNAAEAAGGGDTVVRVVRNVLIWHSTCFQQRGCVAYCCWFWQTDV